MATEGSEVPFFSPLGVTGMTGWPFFSSLGFFSALADLSLLRPH